MEARRKLLLFDIDGTLMTSAGAGEGALTDAMLRRFGVKEDLEGISLAGATDAAIARSLLAKHGLPPTIENTTALLDSYLESLAARLPRHNGRLLPGILPLLEALRARPDCVLGLLTGNVEAGARLKLSHYGVWHFFEFGPFADDHHDRNELGRFARRRAEERAGAEFPPERIWVIGDTPRDVACGKAIGARTAAVATGIYPLEALAACQPDLLLPDLEDTAGVVRALLEEPSISQVGG
ncbi:MAG: haloacid dehalogenase-like hydrolase [Terrimicrobiaceae bacterium]|nr:haloacid dehalogenase-like hydrolase [Terrimicrobiaceae bacterium]